MISSLLQQLPAWLLASTASGIISVLLGVLLSDPIKRFFGRFFRLGRPDAILGKWVCEFEQSREDNTTVFTEVLIIKKSYGYYVGRIEPDARNYERLKETAPRRPVRLKGERTSDGILTGVWYHPIETARSHGAFQLTLSSSGQEMHGVWIGYSNTLGEIDSGRWTITRA